MRWTCCSVIHAADTGMNTTYDAVPGAAVQTVLEQG